jgi:hypothetical protein
VSYKPTLVTSIKATHYDSNHSTVNPTYFPTIESTHSPSVYAANFTPFITALVSSVNNTVI